MLRGPQIVSPTRVVEPPRNEMPSGICGAPFDADPHSAPMMREPVVEHTTAMDHHRPISGNNSTAMSMPNVERTTALDQRGPTVGDQAVPPARISPNLARETGKLHPDLAAGIRDIVSRKG